MCSNNADSTTPTSDFGSDLPILKNGFKCKQDINKSLYWYVRKSLEDMLEDYMLLGNDPSTSTQEKVERSDLINQMCELPLEYDTKSQSLAVALVIQSIRLNVEFTDACATLLMSLSRRRATISDALKNNFSAVVCTVFNQEDMDLNPTSACVEEQKLQDQLILLPDSSTSLRQDVIIKLTELRLQNTANGIKYAKLVIELFRRRYMFATQLLIYLKKLSEKTPTSFFADVLIFMLVEIGQDLEKKLSKGSWTAPIRILSRTSSSDVSSSRDNSTFDLIYNRLESFYAFATSSKSLAAVKKIAADRVTAKQCEAKRSGSTSAEYLSRRSRHIKKTSSLGSVMQSELFGGNSESETVDEIISKL